MFSLIVEPKTKMMIMMMRRRMEQDCIWGNCLGGLEKKF